MDETDDLYAQIRQDERVQREEAALREWLDNGAGLDLLFTREFTEKWAKLAALRVRVAIQLRKAQRADG